MWGLWRRSYTTELKAARKGVQEGVSLLLQLVCVSGKKWPGACCEGVELKTKSAWLVCVASLWLEVLSPFSAPAIVLEHVALASFAVRPCLRADAVP